jgi:cytidine deaminase
MVASVELVKFPELIIGIAGPIGVDIDEITTSLENALKAVGYSSVSVRLTTEMMDFRADVPPPRKTDFFSEIKFKMDYANALCERYGSSATLARIAVRSIRKKRLELTTGDADRIPERTAYIIRQLKRPEEVHLLRQVYGKQFILVSAYGTERERKRRIEVLLPLNSRTGPLRLIGR